jgi:hypothetical protein
MQDCTLDISTMMALAGLKRTRTSSGRLYVPQTVMIPRMPVPVDMATGEMIKPATLKDVPDLKDEDAARRLIKRQDAA